MVTDLTSKFKSNLAYNVIAGLFLAYSIFLIWELPQPYGVVSAIILIIGLMANVLKSKKIKISLFVLSIIGSGIFLCIGTLHVRDNIQKRKKFDLDTEVYFEKGNFEAALKKAKGLNKPIFIDFYTAWCSSCLILSREVFTKKDVGEAMNKAFINLKYDAEKGEGIALAKRYGVSSYPTLLVINSQGDTIARVGHPWIPNDKKMIEIAEKYYTNGQK